uniref:Glycoprotein n=1 Tax=Monopterus albus TaxID=43700 RepID=A0A3Q3JNT6_MONAL
LACHIIWMLCIYRVCVPRFEGVEYFAKLFRKLYGREGNTIVAKVDLCNLMQCDGDPKQYIREDKYICAQAEDRDLYRHEGRGSILHCPTWNFVVANTRLLDWGYYPTSPQTNHLTIVKGYSDPQDCTSNSCNPLLISQKDAKISDSGLHPIDVDVRGSDPIGAFHIKVTKAVSYLENLTIQDVMALETEYADKNEWLEWMTFITRQSNVINSHSTGVFFSPTTEQCKSLSLLYPPVNKGDVPPSVNIYPGNYTCFVRYRAGIRWLCGDGKPTGEARGSFDSRVCLDAIGVPRVPDEFKARSQIAAGFEFFFPEMQLEYVKMFGTFCCTFIPNNTSLDGSITKALEGLTFGKLIASGLISLSVTAALLVVCGCCGIPCLRGLMYRPIDTAQTRTMYQQVRNEDREEEDYEEQDDWV